MNRKTVRLITSPKQNSLDRDQAEGGGRLMAFAYGLDYVVLSHYTRTPGLYVGDVLVCDFETLRAAGEERFAEAGVCVEDSAVLVRFKAEAKRAGELLSSLKGQSK